MQNNLSLDHTAVAANLKRLVADSGTSLTALSRLIGRNDAYLQQFLTRGSPARLPEPERLALAKFFGVDERLLGARDPWSPELAQPPA